MKLFLQAFALVLWDMVRFSTYSAGAGYLFWLAMDNIEWFLLGIAIVLFLGAVFQRAAALQESQLTKHNHWNTK